MTSSILRHRGARTLLAGILLGSIDAAAVFARAPAPQVCAMERAR